MSVSNGWIVEFEGEDGEAMPWLEFGDGTRIGSIGSIGTPVWPSKERAEEHADRWRSKFPDIQFGVRELSEQELELVNRRNVP